MTGLLAMAAMSVAGFVFSLWMAKFDNLEVC